MHWNCTVNPVCCSSVRHIGVDHWCRFCPRFYALLYSWWWDSAKAKIIICIVWFEIRGFWLHKLTADTQWLAILKVVSMVYNREPGSTLLVYWRYWTWTQEYWGLVWTFCKLLVTLCNAICCCTRNCVQCISKHNTARVKVYACDRVSCVDLLLLIVHARGWGQLNECVRTVELPDKLTTGCV